MIGRRRIAGSTVVVVGATSGIGRATALSLAACGAGLVLSARDEDDVDDVVAACRTYGADAIGVAGDLADPSLSERIVGQASEHFGSIDTWINAASALIVGDLVDQPTADISRLVDTNVLGTAFASRVALEHFRAQGHGVLVNVGSLLAIVPNPLVPTYVMSKFAIRGLSLSLHEATAGTAVRVCTVLPGPVDTPMFQHAANYSGRRIRAIPPAASAERAAAAILRSVRRPRRQRTVGLSGATIVVFHHVIPRLVESVVARAAAALVVERQPGPSSPGALADPGGLATVNGGWRRGSTRRRLGDAVGRLTARWAA
jgi:short-subunit dehydrogenase